MAKGDLLMRYFVSSMALSRLRTAHAGKNKRRSGSAAWAEQRGAHPIWSFCTMPNMLISWAIAVRTERRGRRPSENTRAGCETQARWAWQNQWETVCSATHTLDVVAEVVIAARKVLFRTRTPRS